MVETGLVVGNFPAPEDSAAAQPRAAASEGPPMRARLRRIGGLTLSVGLAIWGQHLLTGSPYLLDGLLLYAVAVGLFVRAVTGTEAAPVELRQVELPLPQAMPTGSWTHWRDRRRLLALASLALVFAASAWLAFGSGRFTLLNLILWLGAVVLFWAAFSEPLRIRWRELLGALTSTRLWTSWRLLALVFALLVGVFFRFYQLDRVPAEMTSDHAEKLLDVWDVVNGQFAVFFPRNTGREAMQVYVAAGLIKAFNLPADHLALKLVTAGFGVLILPWVYLLGKELYGAKTGLIATALVAISHWAILIDRSGLRFPMAGAFATPALYFLVRAFKYNRRNDWLLSGLFVGFGLHTYVPIRVLPLLLAVLVGLKLLLDFAQSRRSAAADATGGAGQAWSEAPALTPAFGANALLAAGIALLAFLPLARFMVDHPQVFWFRTLSRTSEVERALPGNPILLFLDNVKNALLMFNYRGDNAWVNNIPFSPALDTVSAAMFTLGVAYVLMRLFRTGDRRTLYLSAMLFFLLLPSTASIAFPIENPGFARMGTAIPVVFIIAALPVSVAVQRLWATIRTPGPRVAPLARLAAGGSLVVLAIFAAKLNYEWYFIEYDRQYRLAAWNTTEMAGVLRGVSASVGDLEHAYHVPYPYWADTRNIGINAVGSPTWNNAVMLQAPDGRERLRQHAADPAAKFYLLHREDEASLRLLRETYSNAQTRVFASATPGKDFTILFVPARQ